MPSAVLVAEPEPATRELLGRQLRDDGFDVLGAARRSEALELAETARPDVVLLAELDLADPAKAVIPDEPADQLRPVGVRDHLDRARLAHELETVIYQGASYPLPAMLLSHRQQQVLANDPVARPVKAKPRHSGDGSGALNDAPVADAQVVHLS